MNFVVVQPKGDELSSVRVFRDESETVTGEFDSWAIDNGDRVMFVNSRMGKALESFWFGGSYMQEGATYALEYHEMCSVMDKYLGPSDRDRAAQAIAESNRLTAELKAGKKRRGGYPTWYKIALIVGLFTALGLVLFLYAMKALAMIVLFPFLLAWIHGIGNSRRS